MKRNLVYAILGIGVIGVCFSLIMFRGNKETSVIEEPTVTIEQVQEEVVDINDKLPDTELDIEVEEVVENEVKAESIGVSEEPSGSIVEPEAPVETIVETTESIEEAPTVEEPVQEQAPAQEPVQEQSKPVESTEVQEVVPADVGRSELQQETLQMLLGGGGCLIEDAPSAAPSTNNTVISNHVWE